jgi:hypothetical protein
MLLNRLEARLPHRLEIELPCRNEFHKLVLPVINDLSQSVAGERIDGRGRSQFLALQQRQHIFADRQGKVIEQARIAKRLNVAVVGTTDELDLDDAGRHGLVAFLQARSELLAKKKSQCVSFPFSSSLRVLGRDHLFKQRQKDGP